MSTNATDRIASIRRLLEDAFAPSQLTIIDTSHEHAGHKGAGGGGHFTVKIVSESFTGKRMLQTHRMVYAALKSMMESEIHALAIEASSPQ